MCRAIEGLAGGQGQRQVRQGAKEGGGVATDGAPMKNAAYADWRPVGRVDGRGESAMDWQPATLGNPKIVKEYCGDCNGVYAALTL